MDKLLTEHKGGIPFSKDQERFDLNSIRDSIDSLTRSLVGGKSVGIMARLFGVVVSEDATNIYVTAGAVIINGEICKVDAQTIAKNADKSYIFDQHNYSPVELRKADLNGVLFDLYQYRRVKLFEYDDTDPYVAGKVLHNKLKDLNGLQSDWTDIAAGGGGSDWSLTSVNHARYFKDPSGNVHLDFNITWDAALETISLFTFPSGFRPGKPLQFSAPNGALISIGTDGGVFITKSPAPDGTQAYLIFRSDL